MRPVTPSPRHPAAPSPCRRLLAGVLGLLFLAGYGCSHPLVRPQAGEEEEQKDKDLEVRTIGDLTDVDNVLPAGVVGVGLVTDLEGTGGGTPPGPYRTMLEEQLRKQRPLLDELFRRQHVTTVAQLLDSPNNALVLVAGLIPAGGRKADRFDLDITLPDQSKVTSLRGGTLQDCVLFTSATTRSIGTAVNPQFAKPDQWLKGHVLARARGPLVVGIGDGDEAVRVRRGRVWEGGVSLTDRPFTLVLKGDKQFQAALSKSVADRLNKSALTNLVAERVNGVFHDDAHQRQMQRLQEMEVMTSQLNHKFPGPALGKGETARPASPREIFINLPYQYRLNPEHYLLVARLIPLQEAAEAQGRYRRKLEQMLLDPARTVRAALRLEALGKESLPALKRGLESPHPLVRYCAAESLAYLGSPSSAEELARLAERYEPLRAGCLTALASLDEAVCHTRLLDLMAVPVPEVRYGAFQALHLLDARDPHLRGELLNESFWLHRVAPNSPPLAHLSCTRRAEVVLFGESPCLLPPVKILAGPEFTVTAERGDDRCVVSRFVMASGKVERHTCSFRLEDVIRTMAEMGGQYPDVVDLLKKAEGWKCVSCAVKADALPQPTPLADLARGGRDPNYLKEPADLPLPRPDAVAGGQ